VKVAIGSVFRDSVGYVSRYLQQIDFLRQRLEHEGHTLRPILVEGDSIDQTEKCLRAYVASHQGSVFVKRAHGGRNFGSVDHPVRWKNLAYACNGVLDSLEEEDDVLIYVESDLIWNVPTMMQLFWHVAGELGSVDTVPHGGKWKGIDAVAPLCFTASGFFYDIWGHRVGETHFTPFPPYHPSLGLKKGPLYPIDSAGSCVVAKGTAARRSRFGDEACIVDYCHGLGTQLWLDPRVWVIHP
jgi:hypothetical protein